MRSTHLVVAAVAATTALALPAAAQAGKIQLLGGTAEFAGSGSEANKVGFRVMDANTVEFSDHGASIVPGPGCSQITSFRFQCHRFDGIRAASIHLGGGVDSFRVLDGGVGVAHFPVRAFGNDGTDRYFGNSSRQPTAVAWSGGEGFDVLSWQPDPEYNVLGIDRGVTLVLDDGVASDGRTGFDKDSFGKDNEFVHGTRFDDLMVGSNDPDISEHFRPYEGRDTIDGRLGLESISAEAQPDGADRIVGGRDGAEVNYFGRTTPVSVVINDGLANDGAPGEGDSLNEVHTINGGSGDDSLLAGGGVPGRTTELNGGAGADAIFGTNGADILQGGSGADRLFGNGGSDTLAHAFGVSRDSDRSVDSLDGGDGIDRGVADAADRLSAVEQPLVGKVRARVTRRGVAVTWRHPVSWRKLRSIELTLRDRQGSVVGTMTVRPDGRLTRQGVGAHVRVTRDGKAATARIRLVHSPALAGRKVTVDVTATDTAGRHQLAPAVTSLRLR